MNKETQARDVVVTTFLQDNDLAQHFQDKALKALAEVAVLPGGHLFTKERTVCLLLSWVVS